MKQGRGTTRRNNEMVNRGKSYFLAGAHSTRIMGLVNLIRTMPAKLNIGHPLNIKNVLNKHQ